MSSNTSSDSQSTALQLFTPSSQIPSTSTTARTKYTSISGAFPGELWMIIRDILEESDDRATLATLSRCNRYFNEIMEKSLYKRFFTDSLQDVNPRPILSFLRTVSDSPRLASHVKTLTIRTVVTDAEDEDDAMEMEASLSTLTTINRQVVMQLFEAADHPASDEMWQLADAAKDMLPTFLPNLQHYHTHEGFLVENVNPWKLSYPQLWATQDAKNRLTSLTTLVIDQKKSEFFHPLFHLMEKWCVVAPNLRAIDVRTWESDFDKDTKTLRPLSRTAPVGSAIEKLREFCFHCYEFSEALDLFFFLWRCRHLESIALTLSDDCEVHPVHFFFYSRLIGDLLWDSGPDILEPAVAPPVAPPIRSLNNEIWDGIFTLKYHTNLKHLTVNNNMLYLATIVRRDEDDPIDTMLTEFLPSSLEVLDLHGVCDQTGYALELLAERVKGGLYPNLREIYITGGTRNGEPILRRGQWREIDRLFRGTNLKLEYYQP